MTTTTTTRHDWEFTLDELPHLHLRAHQADLVVRHAGETGRVTVTLQADAPVERDLIETRTDGRHVHVTVPPLLNADRPGFGFSFQLGNLSIGAGNTVRCRLEVTVPEQADLDLHLGGGDIVIAGTTGALRARTGGGDVRFDEAGDVEVHTGGGDIRAARAAQGSLDTGGGDISIDSLGEGRLHSGGGDVHVGAMGSGAIRTGGGDIHVGGTEGDVTIGTGGGDVVLGACRGLTEVTTGAGDVRVDLRSGRLNIRSGAGDIAVTVPPDVPVWQDLSSPLGDVTSRIGSRGEPAEGQDHLEVVARTGTGDITLR